MKRKILLVEPDYKNKYPPMPLMKLATYFRRCGDDVRFFKGDLQDFAATILTEEAYGKLAMPSLAPHFDLLKKYLKMGHTAFLKDLGLADDENAKELLRRYYRRYRQKDFPKFDVVAVTTLFTFYWVKTIDTINFCKMFVSTEGGRLLVGGIAATILPEFIRAETGIDPIRGLLDKPHMIDADNDIVIDALPLDYSILEEIDYIYPAHDAYFGYMTRGCVRNCPFCAVKTLEPNYKEYLSIEQQLHYTADHFGERRDLLLMDNNVLASSRFFDIVNEICAQGFQKGASYIPPSAYDIAVKNLRYGYNVRGYLRKILAIYDQLEQRLKEKEAVTFREMREQAGLLYLHTASSAAVLSFDNTARTLYEKYFKRKTRQRALDFNQGLDARLVTRGKMEQLARTAIRPLRIAFDHYEEREAYVRAIEMAAECGIRHMSNYLLYNYEDHPEELYERMRINVELCERLDVRIYSFPMKYHPIRDPNYFRNRDFIGIYWNRKFIRAVQAVLNATKGKIGRGKSFFEEAFGENLDEFFDILWMPETFIIERSRYKNSLTREWRAAFQALGREDRVEAEQIIARNDFSVETIRQAAGEDVQHVLYYYTTPKQRK